MSTLLEYLTIGPRMEDQPSSWKRPVIPEQYYGQDDYSEFVVFNAYNNGASLAGAWKDDFGTQFYTLYNGFYTDNLRAFDLGSDDFTIRIQFGLGAYYDYNELEDEYYIPILTLGNLPTVDSPFFLAMTNPGKPANVQKGDFIFSMTDDLGHEAYCFISSNDWYLPTYPAVMHLEFSRTGQVFTLKYNGLYGQKVASNTFPLFRSVNISGVTRAHILSSSGFGSINSYIRALQITKGISRNVGPNCPGAYTVATRYAKMPMLERKSSSSIILAALSSPIVGLEKIYGAKSYVFSEASILSPASPSKSGLAAIDSIAQIVTAGGPPPSDPYWANVAVMFDAKSYTSGSMSTDAKGNGITWHINDNYTWYAVSPPSISDVAGEKALDMRCVGCAEYPSYPRRMTLSPASIDLSANFTIEMFLYLDYLVSDWNRMLISFGSNLITTHSYAFKVFADQDGINHYLGDPMANYFNKILYLAVTRNAGVMKFWLDGIEVASMSAFTVNLSGKLTLGTDNYYNIHTGRIFSARITPGIARTISPAVGMHFPAA